MKFDTFYRLMVNQHINEAEAYEDSDELSEDSLLGTSPVTAPLSDPMSMTPEEKVDYLITTHHFNKNPNWTENDKRAKAKSIVDAGFFDAFVDKEQTQPSIEDDIMPELSSEDDFDEFADEEPSDFDGIEQIPMDEIDSELDDAAMNHIKTGIDHERKLKRNEFDDDE